MFSLALPAWPGIAPKPAGTHRNRVNRYGTGASQYDRKHRRWLRDCGGDAQAELEGCARSLISAHTRLLDVGCGTGAFARRLAGTLPDPPDMTLVDPSPAMLARCGDIAARCVEAPMEDLPFEDASFDLAICAWSFEAATDPAAAASELIRVIRPAGALCLAFCSNKPDGRLLHGLHRWNITRRGLGAFICAHETAAHFNRAGAARIIEIPCAGPAAVLLVRK